MLEGIFTQYHRIMLWRLYYRLLFMHLYQYPEPPFSIIKQWQTIVKSNRSNYSTIYTVLYQTVQSDCKIVKWKYLHAVNFKFSHHITLKENLLVTYINEKYSFEKYNIMIYETSMLLILIGLALICNNYTANVIIMQSYRIFFRYN